MASRTYTSQHKLSKPREWLVDCNNQVTEMSDMLVHSFSMGDVDDPDIYAAQPLWEWQQTEAGQWVMEHAVEDPYWQRVADPATYGCKYYVIARMSTQDQTFFKLKFT